MIGLYSDVTFNHLYIFIYAYILKDVDHAMPCATRTEINKLRTCALVYQSSASSHDNFSYNRLNRNVNVYISTGIDICTEQRKDQGARNWIVQRSDYSVEGLESSVYNSPH